VLADDQTADATLRDDVVVPCAVAPEVLKQVKAGHSKASQMSKQICDVAAQGSRQAGPSLSDALGTTPLVPDASTAKKGSSTFDTLTGSPLGQ